ncbi:MAG: 23S rRNA (guanosine(2251)-2'-O)-methyltransferase RlmB [Deltaproteobacteria bacterium]|nr:23S rRNA (guanosine(2251)-2'-O)-methyltransferase RlmB [Deltaproteobacteria bacterium]
MSRLVFGIHPVQELLRRTERPVQELLLAPDSKVGPLVAAAQARGIKVQRTTRETLDALAGGNTHQGVAAVTGDFPYLDLYGLLERREGTPLLLVVDGVTDPQNLGAMFRSALVLGATGVVLTRDRCAAITATVVRVSSGATEHLPCARVTNLVRAVEELKEAGIWVAAAVEQGGTEPAATDLTGPLAIVLGNEHKGVRPLVQRACDLKLTIPALGRIAALNVASATTALFYEAARQRRQAARATES